MDILGIHSYKTKKREDRDWIGIHNFFEVKLSQLMEEGEKHEKLDGGKNALISEILFELVTGIKHQLQDMKFFDAISMIQPTEVSVSDVNESTVPETSKEGKVSKRKSNQDSSEVEIEVPIPVTTITLESHDQSSTGAPQNNNEDIPSATDTEGISEETLKKLKYAPRTNLGCESNFSVLNAMVGKCGGGVSIQTLSSKRVISKNKFLVRPEMLDLSEQERKSLWSWARRSDAAKKARSIEAEMIDSLRNMKVQALEAKAKKKKKKINRIHELLEKVKEHGGPLTPNTIDLRMKDLSSSQLVDEICYLRAVACPDIKQKRLVIGSDGKRRMVQFPDDILRNNIRNAIKPESDVQDVDSILDAYFKAKKK